MVVGEVPTVVGKRLTGDGVLMAVGQARTKAGVARTKAGVIAAVGHNSRQTSF